MRRHVRPIVDRREQVGGRRGGAWRQQMTLRQERARLRNLTRTACGNEHSPETRVERKLADLFTDFGQAERPTRSTRPTRPTRPARLDDPETFEQGERGLNR